jgi:hypothetical protein
MSRVPGFGFPAWSCLIRLGVGQEFSNPQNSETTRGIAMGDILRCGGVGLPAHRRFP